MPSFLCESSPTGQYTSYEVYCPVGEDSHKKLGMETHLKVVASGYDASETSESHEQAERLQAIRVTGGGPVIQILPGPFPFPDSAAPILKAFGDEREGLESQVKNGPYSNNVTPISGTFTDRKSTRLNSSHLVISYAVFCLKKKKK